MINSDSIIAYERNINLYNLYKRLKKKTFID